MEFILGVVVGGAIVGGLCARRIFKYFTELR